MHVQQQRGSGQISGRSFVLSPRTAHPGRLQTIVVLALLFLVADALLAIFSPASAAADPDSLHPTTLPGTETLLEAPHDDDDWLLPAKTYAGNRYTGLVQIDKANVGTLRMAWKNPPRRRR
jgi:glucose dehydrogenase